MTEPPPKSRKKFLMGCGSVLVLAVFLVCYGPRACYNVYKQNIKSEFRSHRAYYEGIVRQIENDRFREDGLAFYILPENRYAGELKRLEPGDPHWEYYDAIMTGRTVRASNRKGVLMVQIAMSVESYLWLPTQHGVVYCSSELAEPSIDGTYERFEERWSYYRLSLAR